MKTLDSPALVADVLDEYIRELSTIAQITEQQLSATLTNLDSGISPLANAISSARDDQTPGHPC
ncbi:hypothetical protein PshuTeo2_23780 [Pseudomonas hunanensis]|uniref:hypothetical protein n=1 Tax=Pseudomonas hunanensis TaxID=1247546 RepID=UPI002AA0C44C|nr:hypothetical protein [Pseudomonas hunanensis]MDY7072269.1 hypothetical protein [Pseudomonas hunanensis]